MVRALALALAFVRLVPVGTVVVGGTLAKVWAPLRVRAQTVVRVPARVDDLPDQVLSPVLVQASVPVAFLGPAHLSHPD
jgi:hypothetical protein